MKYIHIIIFLLFSGVLLSYQNCTVYQNEGREELESGDSFSGPTKVSDCWPYLSKNLVSAYLREVNIAMALDKGGAGVDEYIRCRIQTDGSTVGLKSPTCVAEEVHRENMESYQNSTPKTLPFVVAQSPSESFPSEGGRDYINYARSISNDSQDFYYTFLATDENASKGVVCYYTILVGSDEDATSIYNSISGDLNEQSKRLADDFLNVLVNE